MKYKRAAQYLRGITTKVTVIAKETKEAGRERLTEEILGSE